MVIAEEEAIAGQYATAIRSALLDAVARRALDEASERLNGYFIPKVVA